MFEVQNSKAAIPMLIIVSIYWYLACKDMAVINVAVKIWYPERMKYMFTVYKQTVPYSCMSDEKNSTYKTL